MADATKEAPELFDAGKKDEKKPKKDGKAAVKDALDSLKGGTGKNAPKGVLNAKAENVKPAGKNDPKPDEKAAAAWAADEAAKKEKAEREAAEKVAAELAKKWEAWPVQMVPTAGIVVENRYRSDAATDQGNAALAASIQKYGQLQPIVVEKGTNKLIAGERRLIVIRDVLKRPEIKAVVADTSNVEGADKAAALLMMEFEENEQRSQPKVADRIARADQIAKLLSKATKGAGAGAGPRTPKRERVAAAAGMSHESLRQARLVLSAAEENPKNAELTKLAEDMNNGEVTIQAAFRNLLSLNAGTLDGAGVPIPKKAAAKFAIVPDMRGFVKDLGAFRKYLKTAFGEPGYERVAAQANGPNSPVHAKVNAAGETSYSVPALDQLMELVEAAVPFCQCPVCAEKFAELGKYDAKCPTCRGSGHVGEGQYEKLKESNDPSLKTFYKLGEAAKKAAKEGDSK